MGELSDAANSLSIKGLRRSYATKIGKLATPSSVRLLNAAPPADELGMPDNRADLPQDALLALAWPPVWPKCSCGQFAYDSQLIRRGENGVLLGLPVSCSQFWLRGK
jgi:hypothetical protein